MAKKNKSKKQAQSQTNPKDSEDMALEATQAQDDAEEREEGEDLAEVVKDEVAEDEVVDDEVVEDVKDQVENIQLNRESKEEEEEVEVPEATEDNTKPVEEERNTPIDTTNVVAEESGKDSSSKKKKKSVGFASPPPELTSHHQDLKKIEQERAKSHPFHQIPPELSYLEKKPDAPKPLPSFSDLNKFPENASNRTRPQQHLGDLCALNIKVISVVNKQTEVNFHYPTIDRPISSNTMIIDVKYASLNSFDLGKISKYVYNVSEQKVGLGYEFVGEISDLGLSLIASGSEYKIGQFVIGCLHPSTRRGSLSTSILVNPKVDIIVPISEDVIKKCEQLKIGIEDESNDFVVDEEENESVVLAPVSTAKPKKSTSSFPVESELPPLAKLSTFPVLYCRAKAALSHSVKSFQSSKRANILINGADTNLGFTLIQLLTSSVYQFLDHLNLILIVKESNAPYLEEIAKKFSKYDPTKFRKITVIPFDLENEDLYVTGEKIPINYKKPNLFACDVLDAMIYEDGVNKSNFSKYQLDLIIDIVGGSQFFQTLSIKYDLIETLSFPFLERISPDTHFGSLLNSKTKEPFLNKILKPKLLGSSYVSCCKYGLKEPSYHVQDLIDESKDSTFSPWNMKWSAGLANSLLSSYNYYNQVELQTKRDWIREGLQCVLDGELKFRIDKYDDWRNRSREIIQSLKRDDKKVIFKIESF